VVLRIWECALARLCAERTVARIARALARKRLRPVRSALRASRGVQDLRSSSSIGRVRTALLRA
jgi:hypothetical protein